MNRREALVNYMRSCVESEDWHAVSDAANDLRELDAAADMARHLRAPKPRTDIDLPPLPEPFVDERGSIQNLFEAAEDEEPARGVAVIESKAGTVRSNHWHRTDWHYLYVLKGALVYEWRDAEGPGAEVKRAELRTGALLFTGPKVWHRVTFAADTTLVSVSRLSRRHAEHEADLVRDPG